MIIVKKRFTLERLNRLYEVGAEIRKEDLTPSEYERIQAHGLAEAVMEKVEDPQPDPKPEPTPEPKPEPKPKPKAKAKPKQKQEEE